jgi:CheY-like chemotaxis protein
MSDATSILIVDDEGPARSRLREVLSDLAPQFPHRIVGEAANAPEALAQIESQRPQIVLMDVQMPGMTGIELARHISARAAEADQDDPKPMPLIIFVTATLMDPAGQALAAAQMPLETEELAPSDTSLELPPELSAYEPPLPK